MHGGHHLFRLSDALLLLQIGAHSVKVGAVRTFFVRNVSLVYRTGTVGMRASYYLIVRWWKFSAGVLTFVHSATTFSPS